MSAVSEIMSSPKKIVAASIKPGLSALDMAKLMIKNKVGSVVLMDGDERPVGIITERDILRKVAASNKPAKSIAAKDIMSSPVITVKAFDSIETAAAVMTKNKIKRLVVVEQDDSLAGVLSVTDIARKLAKILADDYNRYGHLKAILDL
ncbi:putative signal transduction protein with CBS domains [Candidatus Nitrososphaera gargensis Ga9.2]|uniref:Putative signal transduction protein with CBS domains n=1 Tax=Nitrososphaera gargensis (strain Ga9.2) TaxID=1237085 RepID=K0IE39_NITGG|nr:CBS domain-containing protein [Candidatus Nitrososphaera gargensis]AFU57083.1 putative signal transduction protein with CBS domains [Candidatus Nitrososphaera gargensis Ga9.2]